MVSRRDQHEDNPKVQQSINTSFQTARAGVPSPEAQAEQRTASVLHGTRPNEARQRIDAAVQAYQARLKEQTVASLTPQDKYLRELGRFAQDRNHQVSLQNWENLAEVDKKIGTRLIRSQGVTEKELTYTLERHSPGAVKYPPGRTDYAVGMAKTCDEIAQGQHERKMNNQDLQRLTELQQLQMQALHKERG